MDLDQTRVQDDLRGALEGDVLFGDLYTQMYATDASIYQMRPFGVVRPRSVEDVAVVVRYAVENQLSLHARGAGSSLAGEALGRGIVLDFTRYMRRVRVTGDQSVRVQPGVVLAALNRELAGYGRIYGPDPATRSVTSMGSVIAQDASGSHFLRYGSARGTVESLQVVTGTGEIVELSRHEPDAPGIGGRLAADVRRVAERYREHLGLLGGNGAIGRGGYRIDLATSLPPLGAAGQASGGQANGGQANGGQANGRQANGGEFDGSVDLARLIAGSEGTLALVTEAALRTEPLPKHRGVALLFFRRLESAARGALLAVAQGAVACDLMDRRLLEIARETDRRYDDLIPRETEAMILVEMQGEGLAELRSRLRAVVAEACETQGMAFAARTTTEQAERDFYWRLCRRVIPRLYRLKGNSRPLPFVEDLAVPPQRLPEFLVEVQEVLKRQHVTSTVFAHAGHGQLHLRPFLDLGDPEDQKRIAPLVDQLFEVTTKFGGSVCGEHGAGLSRTALLRRQLGPLWPAMGEIKRAFDPFGVLNPGKVVASRLPRPDENLRSVRATIALRPFGNSPPRGKPAAAKPAAGPESASPKQTPPPAAASELAGRAAPLPPGARQSTSSRQPASSRESAGAAVPGRPGTRHREDPRGGEGDGGGPGEAAAWGRSGAAVAMAEAVEEEQRSERAAAVTDSLVPEAESKSTAAVGSREAVGAEEVVGTSVAAAEPAEVVLPLLQVWESEGGLERVTRECNGCGRCRSTAPHERMCPVFRAIPAEEASPRAKANVMRGILTGELPPETLVSDEMKKVADLCFNCHQCRLECPASVDIPKIVSEIKGQYVATNGLPLSDLWLCRLDTVASIASHMPSLANWIIRSPVMRFLLERTVGLTRARRLPEFTHRSFMRYATRNRLTRQSRKSGEKIVYFVDHYANWHDPELGRALVEVMHHNRIEVFVPPRQAPSGMTRIAAGDLRGARRRARHNVRLLADAVRAGYTIVATEPTAALCLRHEYLHLLDNEDARLVAENTYEACRYLWDLHCRNGLALDFQPVPTEIAYHQPCHVRAIDPGQPGPQLMRLLPRVSVEDVDEGCSGMAGTWGLQKKNYRNSLRIGWPLLSRLRKSDVMTAATECSTCQMQIEHGSGVTTIHPVKLLAYAYGKMPELGKQLGLSR
ncbi:anaerobic glycerol-3-phosphate dehydrogenase subunit C [Candidatus Laterigemmans baculatus]|uniref:anaerobic glycerol-3-phosphate dehydrogenase subunit C n=1 Tax=Candidatus Laterigemmans baculatus TaxID=2770505 RepID=UPI0013D9BF64|nr:anaerobic glycerol-3-phosphate dehydrogenase subunit C [Candidatus Laterigemmans baculatus]